MADEEVEMEQADDTKDRQGKEAAAAMDKMSSHEPERQMDESKVRKAMDVLAATQKANKAAQLQREKELAAVKVNKEDIDVIAGEFEMDKKSAERRLRESNGVLIDALRALL